jgi:hypothetical protein
MSTQGGCFITGTLVHIKEGLKPIEEIKVGDYVLSKPEDGKGDQAYKRVTKTLQFEEKEVWCVEMFRMNDIDQAKREGRMVKQELAFKLIVTPNHPFWVKGIGWTRADGLFHTSSEHLPQLILSNGEIAIASWSGPMKRSVKSSFAWTPLPDGYDGRLSDFGAFIDLSQGGLSAEFDLPNAIIHENRDIEWRKPENAYRSSVYNLKIEDFHTYFVGTFGVWVHDASLHPCS